MKKLLVLLPVLAPIAILAQTDTAISYTGIVVVEGVNSNELFSRARSWFNTTYNDAKEVLQIADKENGHLAGKGRTVIDFKQKAAFGVTQTVSTALRYNIDVWVKDGRYKFRITDIDAQDRSAASYHYGILTSSEHMPIKMAMVSAKKADAFWSNIKSAATNHFSELSASLKQAMSAGTEDNNW